MNARTKITSQVDTWVKAFKRQGGAPAGYIHDQYVVSMLLAHSDQQLEKLVSTDVKTVANQIWPQIRLGTPKGAGSTLNTIALALTESQHPNCVRKEYNNSGAVYFRGIKSDKWTMEAYEANYKMVIDTLLRHL